MKPEQYTIFKKGWGGGVGKSKEELLEIMCMKSLALTLSFSYKEYLKVTKKLMRGKFSSVRKFS